MLHRKSVSASMLKFIWGLTVRNIQADAPPRMIDVPFAYVQMQTRSEEFVFTRQRLDRLVAGGYLTVVGGFERLVFTKLGLIQLVVWCIADQLRAPESNGQLCIVSFDVPEKYKKSRDDLRRFLKSTGCTKIHKSTWVSDRDIGLHVKYAAHLFGLTSYVRVFIGKSI